MKLRGSVTVFLALIVACCASLICALTESARTAGARYYVQNMADSAMDSLFSRYHPQLWECYRLLGYRYKEDETCISELTEAMKPYAENCGWYAITSPEVSIDRKSFLTDDGGQWFEQEVTDYMKYGWINMDITPASAETLWKQVKEAQTMNKIIRDYGLQSRQAAAMEKAISKIQKNLDEQKALKAEARSLVRDGDNTGFQGKAAQLDIKVRELPGLIEKYDEKADEFSEKLNETEAKHREELESLEESNREALTSQLDSCREYADRDGVRRLQIDALDDNNDNELNTIADVRELADETEEYIEEAEEDDDEDEDGGGDDIDEDALWEEVAEAWDAVAVPVLGTSGGLRDEKAEEALESILKLVEKGYLEIFLPPDRSIPKNEIDATDFPSKNDVTARTDGGPNLLTAAVVDAYAGQYLPSFTDNTKGNITCQLEYAVAGLGSDEANLTMSTAEILAIREALNFIYIMTDTKMRNKVKATAKLIVAAAAAPALLTLVECLIISAWALVESFMDLRLMLEGKKAALFKTKNDWMTEYSDIPKFAASLKLQEKKLKESAAGITYETYLQLLLFTKSAEERDYRIMDMIQACIVPDDKNFRMKNCLYGMKTEVSCESRHIFTMLGISYTNGRIDAMFPIKQESVKAY